MVGRRIMTSGWTARVLTCILLDGVNLLDIGLRDQGRVEQVEVHYRLPYRTIASFLSVIGQSGYSWGRICYWIVF